VQCGCECTRCTVDGQPFSDSATCNDKSATNLDCLEHNKQNCGNQFSDEDQIPYCSILSPSKWPPLYELTTALDPPPASANDSSSSNSSSSGSDGSSSDSSDGGGLADGCSRTLHQNTS
jgi:hypothetical protein